jgi:hypothetical protein
MQATIPHYGFTHAESLRGAGSRLILDVGLPSN